MNWQASADRPIQVPRQLLVEGRTAEIFFRAWIESTHLKDNMEARRFASVGELDGFLRVFCSKRDFREKVASLGIIRDAEAMPAAIAFDSVCASLKAAGLTPPPAICSYSDGVPRTGVFILPDCQQPGMLETLCWSALEADANIAAQLDCVRAFLNCLRLNTQIQNEAKARVWTYLAGKGDFDPQVGRAAQTKVWNWSSPAFTQLFGFLNAL